MINVLFLYTVNPGVTYYRMYQYARRMSELGLAQCRLFPDWDPKRLISPDWERKLDEYVDLLDDMVKWSDVVVCQYISSPEGLSTVEAIRDLKPILMEVDDYFSQVPHQSSAYNENRPGDPQDFWATRQMVASNGLVVSTPWLKEKYGHYNSRINVIRNTVDVDEYDRHPSPEHDTVRIGWIGGASHEGDLKLVKEVLYDLLTRYPNLEVHIVSFPPPYWKPTERLFMHHSWAFIDEYPKHLKGLGFDIGICPLRDHLFNRGKSNLRYLEYSACAIPTVASTVEPFKNNGFTGYLAGSEKEWFDALSNLIEDHKLRKQLGEDAYQTVREKYNPIDVAKEYSAVLKRYGGHENG